MPTKTTDQIRPDNNPPNMRQDDETSSLVPMLIAGLALVTLGYGVIMLFV